MPLYMDIHTVDSDTFSVEDVVKAHMQDLAIQDKFGVTQLKYWVNEDAKTLFCLMDGPNKESCHQVHKLSHGNTACNIIEVSENEYNLFMGGGTAVNDLARTQSGDLDTGYRTILLTNIVFFLENNKYYSQKVFQFIEQHDGVLIIEPGKELMVSFIYASDAILFANSIKNLIRSIPDKIEYILAISSGRPVDEQGDNMFGETKMKVKALCTLGLSKMMYIDKETQKLAEKEVLTPKVTLNSFTIIQNEDIKLAVELSKLISKNLTNSEFKSKDLPVALYLSKSQTYRRIKALTQMAPNQLIQESRLQKAVNSVTQDKTISEIAYDFGFSNPAYFSRTFKKRFGISPTDFTKQQS